MLRKPSPPRASQPVETVVLESPAEPQDVAHVCGTCGHWRQRPNAPAFGECLPSHAGLQAPIITPNLSACTLWKQKGA